MINIVFLSLIVSLTLIALALISAIAGVFRQSLSVNQAAIEALQASTQQAITQAQAPPEVLIGFMPMHGVDYGAGNGNFLGTNYQQY